MVDLPFGQQGRKLLEDGLDEVRWKRGHRRTPSSGSLENSPDDRASCVRFPFRVIVPYPRKLLACVLTPLAAKDAVISRWVHDGRTMEPPDALHDFRRSFYECFHRRSDALFELTDAILGTDAAAPSPVHLSLRPAHRRGWGASTRL